MSNKNKDKQHFKERFEDRVFNIRLKSTQEELDLGSNSHFVKIIEQEYATKYLESLGIEPTQKSIIAILKKYPLKNCEITAGWNITDTGLYADTITIVTRHRTTKKEKQFDKSDTGDDIVQQLDLKKMNLANLQPPKNKSYKQHTETSAHAQTQLEEQAVNDGSDHEESKVKFKLDYSIEVIKKKYLFPFNQSFQRRMNINLRNSDKQEFPSLSGQSGSDQTSSVHDKFLIFESKVFSFPFIHIEVQPALLRDLQRPPQIMPQDIEKILKRIIKSFPKEIFPIRPLAPEKKKKTKFAYDISAEKREESLQKNNDALLLSMNSRYIIFHQDQLNAAYEQLQGQEMVKFVGVFIHFSYWLVFGITQPLCIEALTKKQMYIQMMEIIEYFSSKMHGSKLWMQLYFPMILLTLKMAVEYYYKNNYPTFFEQNLSELNTPGQIAIDKIFYLIERLFDQNNLFCRFTFLESDFKNKSVSMGTANDRKFMQKRIFGISPFIDLLISNPQDGRSRAILAKQHDIDIRDNVLNIRNLEQDRTASQPLKLITKTLAGNKAMEEKIAIEKSQKQKMFNIMLNRMDQDIEGVLGKKSLLTFKNA